MTCIINNKFQHVTKFTETLILNTLEVNLKYFLDNALLNIGAWTDITIDQPQINGNSISKLKSVSDPSFQDGVIWEGLRKDWVWENDVQFENHSPLTINSININGNNITTNYNIDYINGRIILDNPISQSSEVKVSYSFRNVQVYRASDSPWWQLLQSDSFDPSTLIYSNNNWSVGPHHRVQMPCIIIDSVARSKNLPFELGNRSLIIEQDVILNILAETKNERNHLLDILRLQQDNTIWLYDLNKAAQNNKLPLDHNGFKNLAGLSYNQLINQYKWGKILFKQISLAEVSSFHMNLYEGLVRITFEIIFNGFNI